MQSLELPRDQTIADSAATAGTAADAGGGAEPADLRALPAAVLLKLLLQRFRLAARDQWNRAARAFAQARAQTLALARPLTFAQARTHIGRRKRPLAIIAIAAAVPAAYLIYCIATIPFTNGPSPQASPGALVVQDETGRVFATRGIFKGDRVAADKLPATVASAVTSIEDRRFYQHGGIDLRATTRAAWHDLTGRRLEGGSTIAQQLARRLYLTPDRTVKRKVQEAMLAIWLELRLSKKQILARYLDTAYFGDGAYGIDAAAERYFGKSANELTLSEAAMLAGLIKAPSELAPDRNPVGAQQRAGVVLNAMVETGAITPQQADIARQNPAVLHIPAEAAPGSNYFIDTAAVEAKSLTGSSADDLTIRTTLNPELQQIAESVVAKRLAASGKAKNASQAALVALAPDGAILAMVGGRDYNESQFNRVTQARRQPGSLFKAFVYLAALRKGYTPDSVMIDQPVDVGDWEPENYGDHYYGPVTLRTAFAHSLNSVAVQLAQAVGIQTVIDTAKQLGVRSELPAVPSVALGSGAVSPLEMTRAFAAIATNTANIDGYAVRDISKANQTVYTRAAPQLATADNLLIHSEMLDLLTDVTREGTGTAARLDRPVGGKTGTSEEYRDAWFVGFTSDLVVGVWVGNDDNSPTNGVTGGSLPASIWHDFVSAAEPLRRPQNGPVDSSAPTISFNGVGAESANADGRSGYPNDSGWRQPFRLFFPGFHW
jgi:penicillin-binding protein 1A